MSGFDFNAWLEDYSRAKYSADRRKAEYEMYAGWVESGIGIAGGIAGGDFDYSTIGGTAGSALRDYGQYTGMEYYLGYGIPGFEQLALSKLGLGTAPTAGEREGGGLLTIILLIILLIFLWKYVL